MTGCKIEKYRISNSSLAQIVVTGFTDNLAGEEVAAYINEWLQDHEEYQYNTGSENYNA